MKKYILSVLILISSLVLLMGSVSALTVTLTNPTTGGAYEDSIGVTWTVAGGNIDGAVGFNGYYMQGHVCNNTNFILYGMPAFSGKTYAQQPIPWDTSALSDSTQYCFRVITNDGSNEFDTEGYFTLDNNAPVIDSLAVTDHGDEDGTETDISFSYHDTIGVTSCNIDWGDGNNVNNCLAWGGVGSHSYAQDGAYTITLSIEDAIGHETTQTVVANPINVAPSIDSLDAGIAINENGITTFTATLSDPGADDSTLSYVINWGDGTANTVSSTGTDSISETHQYLDDDADDSYTVTLTVTDSDGASDVDTDTITVNNVNPVAFTNGPYTINEGSSLALSGSATDVGTLDTFSYAWDLDNDGFYDDSAIWNPTYNCPQDAVAQTINLQVTDDDGGVDTDTTTVTCNNVAPSISDWSLSSYSINEMDSVTLSATLSDPGADDDTLDYVINWGDGTSTSSSTGTDSISVAHQYLDDDGDDTYDVTLTITDSDGASDSDTTTITVNDVNPIITNLPDSAEATMHEAFSFDVEASDIAGGNDPLTYSLTNGNPAGMTINPATGLIEWTPGLGQDGDYLISVTVNDGDGGTDTEVLTLHVYGFALHLNTGWNLISFPLVAADTDATIILDDIKDTVNKIWVYRYNEDTESNEWYYQEVVGENWVGSPEFTEIESGLGYYIEMKSEDDLFQDGEKMYDLGGGMSTPPVQTVTPGWNLIGHYGMKQNVANADAFETLSGHYSTLLDKDGAVQTDLDPTNGYWLFVTGTENLEYAPSTESYDY